MCCCRWLLLVVILIFGTVASAGPDRPAREPSPDVTHTIQARKLLADDPELANWNLGVFVTDRVAVLWGPAPSAEVAFRAEERLRTMIELVGVQNKLFVCESIEPVRAAPAADVPLRVLPTILPSKLPMDPRLTLGAPAMLTAQEKEEPKNGQMPSSRKAKSPPVQIQIIPLESLPEALPRKLPSGDPAELELAAAIRMLLQTKPAYRSVEFLVQGRRVYLRSTDPDTDALHEASRAIARLPNVDGVVLVDKTHPR
jgi:hypothetical protein